MAQFKWLRPPWKRNDHVSVQAPVTAVPVTAEPDAADAVTGAFVERNIGFCGNLKGFDYDQILRDKEGNIDKIYMLADYYVDKDPQIRGIIKEVYTPFSSSGGWKLVGKGELEKRVYMDYYRRIGLDQFMRAVFYQYYKYGNVFIYMMPDGHLVTMPVRRMRIGNVTVNGTPVMEFDAGGVVREMRASGLLSEKHFIQDDELSVRLGGYPKEVIEGIRNGAQWVQLNPANSFLMQDVKEDWTRYAYPLITACLSALAKKELISTYEDSVLNLGMRGFVHATYGDPDDKQLPDRTQLTAVDQLIRKAMTRTSLATTNQWAKVEFVQADTRYLYEYDKYRQVNNDILSAGGISGIIVSGVAQDSSTFASAQVSLETAELRILQARARFEEIMNQVNRRARNRGIVRAREAPRFAFAPLDLKGNAKFQESCMKLWEQGAVSTRTMMEAHGFDVDQERQRIRLEQVDGTSELMRPVETKPAVESEGKVGRPPVGDFDTDKSKSRTGAQPKPSNEEGSL